MHFAAGIYNRKYNSIVSKIIFQLKLCGDNTINKDFLEELSIFHASNAMLQYRNCQNDFKEHFELITCLLVPK